MVVEKFAGVTAMSLALMILLSLIHSVAFLTCFNLSQ